MGRFDGAARADANHGANRKDNYLNYVTDSGESIFIVESMPDKDTTNGKNVVVTTFRCILTDSTGGLKFGQDRQHIFNTGEGGQPGKIRAQEFKSLVTAAAGVPLADESCVEAIERLVKLTGAKHGIAGDLNEADPAMLQGARDSLINKLMEKWTAGEGALPAGYPFVVNAWRGKDGKNKRNETITFTQFRFSLVPPELLAELDAIIEAEADGKAKDTVKALWDNYKKTNPK